MMVTFVNAAALAVVAMLIVGCDSAPTAGRHASRTPSSGRDCTTSAAQGRCGPYDSYSRITGTTSSTYVGNNVWNPVGRWRQTLSARGPGHWAVAANVPAGNTAAVSYPSVGANYGQNTNVPTPLNDYSSIYSSFSEVMSQTAKTSAWATYDIWLGPADCSPADCSSYEVMIQLDFANNGACESLATASFGGAGGFRCRAGICASSVRSASGNSAPTRTTESVHGPAILTSSAC